MKEVIRQKCKIIQTLGRDSEVNGYIAELFKQENRTTAYLNVLSPKTFKGYHVHTRRTNKIVCIQGEVVVSTFQEGELKKDILSAKNLSRMEIPPGIPTALENLANYDAVLIFLPDPAFDPTTKGEQFVINREDIEK